MTPIFGCGSRRSVGLWKWSKCACVSSTRSIGGRSRIFRPERLMRLSRNSQFAKFGSISTFRSVNWIRNDAWPIQVMATWPRDNLGKTGRRCCPVRGVSRAFQTSSRKNVRGLKCLRRRQILERARQSPRRQRGTLRKWFRHTTTVFYARRPVNEMENAASIFFEYSADFFNSVPGDLRC